MYEQETSSGNETLLREVNGQHGSSVKHVVYIEEQAASCSAKLNVTRVEEGGV